MINYNVKKQNQKNNLRVNFVSSAIIVCAFFISGCHNLGGEFDCNVSSGGMCMPTHKINKMADDGVFTGNYPPSAHNQSSANSAGGASSFSGYPLSSYVGEPIRSGESIQQIWIGPYEDINGIYHESSYVYAVIKNGHWIGEPESEIKDADNN